jgi:hypothetical protein
VIEEGMTTFKGFPGPILCDYWDRAASAAHYDDGSSFQIGRIDMIANTGTYVDSPFHRYADGADLSELPLESLADLDAIVIRKPFEQGLATDAADFAGLAVRGKAVLVHTGWDRHWRTDFYFRQSPLPHRRGADGLRRGRRVRRHRQPQYRRHTHPLAPGPQHIAWRRHPHRRASHQPRLRPRRRFPILRRPAQGQGNGDLPVRAYARVTREHDVRQGLKGKGSVIEVTT